MGNCGKIEKQIYIVDPASGPFFKIQDAIDQAKNNTIIKISPGVYKENLRITNKSIWIEGGNLNQR